MRRGYRAPLAAALVLIVALLTFWIVTHPWGCSGVDVETISEEQRVALIGHGWRSDPDDDRDALYPPECAP
jgi:hypothetical protein